MQQTLALIRVSLEAEADPAHAENTRNFFKESIHPLGVRSPGMQRILASAWKRVSHWDKDDILELCEHLWQAGTLEQGALANKLAAKLSKKLKRSDFRRLERWMDTYVANWAHCDGLANHSVGDLVEAHPSLHHRLMDWTASPNRWMRRGACVALCTPLRHDRFPLEEALKLSDLLMDDPDDLVQKGVGWMLKEATHHNAMNIFRYVQDNKDGMARITLRTAIEKLPPEQKKLAMAKQPQERS